MASLSSTTNILGQQPPVPGHAPNGNSPQSRRKRMEKNIQCPHCLGMYTMQGIRRRMNGKHKDRGEEAHASGKDGAIQERCPLCAILCRRYSMRKHIRKLHSHIWDPALSVVAMFAKHDGASEIKWKFQCALCSCKSWTAHSHRVHIRTRHPEVWDRSLTAEQMLDPERQPQAEVHKCPLCDKMCSSLRGLTQHERTKHPSPLPSN